LDRSLWGNKFGGGTGSQLISGLRFLGLLKDEKPTERLEPIVRAQSDQRKHLLADLFRDAYGASVIDGLSGMTPKMLTDEIDKLGASDATARKAFSFVVNAAKANNIPIASTIAKKARNKPSGKRTASGNRKKETPATPADTVPPAQQPTEEPKHAANTRTVKLASGGEVTVSLSVDLFDLGEEDRTFVLAIIDKLKAYNAHQKPGEAADGKNGEAPGLQGSAAAPGASERSVE
ncbi:MAG: hypothetical protein ACRD1T_27465, partial [Acidimicrobiia bacterium]